MIYHTDAVFCSMDNLTREGSPVSLRRVTNEDGDQVLYIEQGKAAVAIPWDDALEFAQDLVKWVKKASA